MIKRQVMYQNYDKGGLRVPNVDVMIKSLRLAWIPRLLSNDERWSEVWARLSSTNRSSRNEFSEFTNGTFSRTVNLPRSIT